MQIQSRLGGTWEISSSAYGWTAQHSHLERGDVGPMGAAGGPVCVTARTLEDVYTEVEAYESSVEEERALRVSSSLSARDLRDLIEALDDHVECKLAEQKCAPWRDEMSDEEADDDTTYSKEDLENVLVHLQILRAKLAPVVEGF